MVDYGTLHPVLCFGGLGSLFSKTTAHWTLGCLLFGGCLISYYVTYKINDLLK
jgi:hypothetical protein